MCVICFQVLATYITLPLATVTTYGNTTKKQVVRTFLFHPALLTISPYHKKTCIYFLSSKHSSSKEKKVAKTGIKCLRHLTPVCTSISLCVPICWPAICTVAARFTKLMHHTIDIRTTVAHFSTSYYWVNSMLL